VRLFFAALPKGAIKKSERSLSMRVADIMSSPVEFCTPDTDLQYVARKMEECDCGAIPVVDTSESMKPVGIITDRDITIRAVAKGQNPLDLRAEDCMSTDLLCVKPDEDLRRCLDQMEQRKVRRVVVTDDQGRCCGILAQADVAENASRNETAELVRDVSEPGQLGHGIYH
jgi:CBS domain-containing protein